jgi:hypothetical protein
VAVVSVTAVEVIAVYLRINKPECDKTSGHQVKVNMFGLPR